jgi:dienelactone hydrolase
MKNVVCMIFFAMCILLLVAAAVAGDGGETGAPVQGKIVSPVSTMMDAYEVDLRKDQGIEPGDIVQVIRDGKQIATGVIIASGQSTSRVVLNGNPPQCMPGDVVRFLRHKKTLQASTVSRPGTSSRPGSSSAGGRVTLSIALEITGKTPADAALQADHYNKVSFSYRAQGRERTVEGYLLVQPTLSPAVVFAQASGTEANDERDTLGLMGQDGFSGLVMDYSDHLDVLAGIEYLQSMSFVDPGKIGLIGFDRGGGCVVFAAEYASGIKGVVDIAGRFVIDGKEIANASQSPLTYLDRINCPVLVVHGGKDRTVPVEDAYTLEQKLRDMKKISELKILPLEGHDIQVWDQTIHEACRFLLDHM